MRNTNPGERLLRHKPLFIGAYPRNAINEDRKLLHLEKLFLQDTIDIPFLIVLAKASNIDEEKLQKLLVKHSVISMEDLL